MVSSGVYDAEKHANLAPMKWLDQDFKGVEAALVKWAEWCATARECQFRTMISTAPEGPSPSSVLTKVKDMLNTAYLGYDGTPVTVNSLSTNEPGIWPYEYLVQRIRTYLYEQSSWTSLESLFRNLERSQTIGSSRSFKNDDDNDDDDDGDDIVKLDSRLATSGPALYAPLLPYLTSYVSYAIYCGDIVDSKGETTQDLFNLTVQAAQSVSPNFASLTPAYSLRSLCHNWKSRAVERLPQPMTKKPKNIVLVIGNTADPATPYESAQRLASSAFFGAQARLVKFDAAGHSSRAAESTCIDGVLSNYVNGNPPADKGNDEEDVVCATTLASFPPSGGTSIDSGAPRMGRQLANNVSLIIAALVGITMFMC
ncbi:hypothetical protein FRC17_001767 [Serendipita sp. 399]|nr:hypothetical protein FRC17_001767 [Serendipita sp. 399]